MRVVFIGSTAFGLRCLEAISTLEAVEIVGVITNPASFSISYSRTQVSNVLHADLLAWADGRGVPTYEMRENMRETALLPWLTARMPDLLVVVGWYHMIPRSLRAVAPAVALHASLLPDYSGGAPLVWAIINGEQRTGITLFELADGVDDGPIHAQRSLDILADDTIATLYARVEILGLELLQSHLPVIADGGARPVPQDGRGRRVFPQRSPQDGRIDWHQPAHRIHDFVRAQTKPYPGAFTTINGMTLKIWSSRLCREGSLQRACGVATRHRDSVVVGCAEGTSIELCSFEFKDASDEFLRMLESRVGEPPPTLQLGT